MSSSPKINQKTFIELLNEDSVDNLKRQLKSYMLMVMAIMDTQDIEQIKVPSKTLLCADGGLETYYDFDTDSYVIRRIKVLGGEKE